jgi:hypothetical protein
MRFDVPVPDQHTRKLCSLWPLICFTCRLGKVFGGISLVYQLPLAFVFKVQLTEQQRLLGGNMYCKQHVMPPHDSGKSLWVPWYIFSFTDWRAGSNWPLLDRKYGSLQVPGHARLRSMAAKASLFWCVFMTEDIICYNIFLCVFVRVSILGHVNLCASAGVWGWGWRPTALWDHDNFANAFVFIINPRLPYFMCRPELWQDNKWSPESYPPSTGVELWIPSKLSLNWFILFSPNGW